MSIVIGTDRIIREIKLEDLYIPKELIKTLIRLSSDETDKSEYIGLIKHNDNRYIILPEEQVIIEFYRGKSSYSTALIPS